MNESCCCPRTAVLLPPRGLLLSSTSDHFYHCPSYRLALFEHCHLLPRLPPPHPNQFDHYSRSFKNPHTHVANLFFSFFLMPPRIHVLFTIFPLLLLSSPSGPLPACSHALPTETHDHVLQNSICIIPSSTFPLSSQSIPSPNIIQYLKKTEKEQEK